MSRNMDGNRAGQVLVLVAVAILGLVAITGVAVDGGSAFNHRRHAQSAADSAALAAALAKVSQQPNWQAVAMQIVTQNGFDPVQMEIHNPPSTQDCRPEDGKASPYVGNQEYVQVILRSTAPAYFAPVVGFNQFPICVESVARAQPPVNGPLYDGNAMVALSCIDPAGVKAYQAQGNVTLRVHGGGIFSNSSADNALYTGGNAAIWAPGYAVVGGWDGNGELYNEDGTVQGVVTVGVPPYPCPPKLEEIIPTPSCSQDGTKNPTTKIVTPGNIPATYLENNAYLQPGIYCISGGKATINAGNVLEGDGVLLFFQDDAYMHISGGATVQLSAATSGPYAGLLIYSLMSNRNDFILNGNSSSYWTGTILLPGSEVQINGTGASSGYHSQIISDTIFYGGTADGEIWFSADENFKASSSATVELTQ